MSQLYQNALYGTALILAVIFLRRVLKERFIPEARLALWAVCLFRLLTPAAPESVLSLWGLSRLFAAQPQPAAPAPVPAVPVYTLAPSASHVPAPPSGPAISWETVLIAVWLAVGAALAVRYLISWKRTRRAVSCAIPLDRDDPRYAPLPKCARLREGPMEGAPLTFGALRPTVVLSPGLSGEALDCVLAHEGVHAARRDNLWHYAAALALVVHWWNPAVWWMARLLRRDVELSCDRAALKKLGGERRADYAQALVTLAVQGSGPAFCQTFGRKAAEERIISIMKFKKTSIIGVIFSLTLVLALTVAFASEPKELPPDTVTFHGQTFSRSELSQETLDWLDWYLALHSDEDRLAISYVPAELRGSLTPETKEPDAYDSVKTSSKVVSVPDVDATKDVTSDFPEVDPDDVDLNEEKARLDQMVSDGKLTQEDADATLAGIEDMLEQARRGELKLFRYTDQDGYEFIYGSGVAKMYYQNEDGTLTPFDPGSAVSGYEVNPPTFDEDGNPVAADGSIVGSHYYSYSVASPQDSAADNTMSDIYVENGYTLDADGNALVYDDSGSLFMTAKAGYLPCIREDCTVAGEHYHKDGEVVPCSESNAPTPVFEPTVDNVPVKYPYCPVCDETRLHQHVDGQTVLLPDPCPAEGCTITGSHIHGDTCYSCNGAGHDGGYCDGSCYTYTASNATATSTHHSETHHSESHHSSHH